MKKILLILFACFAAFLITTAQVKQNLSSASVVKDTSGTVIPYAIWTQLMMTGRYNIKSGKAENEKTEFVIYRLPDEEYEKRFETMPKPKESNYFKTSSSFAHFKTKDINGNKINTKNLDGKIIVLNFWFIKCGPCQKEIPDLNKLAESYKSDSTVVFYAIALDQKFELEEFLKTTAFGYTIVDNGRFVAAQYGINSYPTNVIIDQHGKVYFHSTGLAMNTVYWLKKSIAELKASGEKEPAGTQ
jgi:thiol-disulfide isomerase/thioredoxin